MGGDVLRSLTAAAVPAGGRAAQPGDSLADCSDRTAPWSGGASRGFFRSAQQHEQGPEKPASQRNLVVREPRYSKNAGRSSLAAPAAPSASPAAAAAPPAGLFGSWLLQNLIPQRWTGGVRRPRGPQHRRRRHQQQRQQRQELSSEPAAMPTTLQQQQQQDFLPSAFPLAAFQAEENMPPEFLRRPSNSIMQQLLQTKGGPCGLSDTAAAAATPREPESLAAPDSAAAAASVAAAAADLAVAGGMLKHVETRSAASNRGGAAGNSRSTSSNTEGGTRIKGRGSAGQRESSSSGRGGLVNSCPLFPLSGPFSTSAAAAAAAATAATAPVAVDAEKDIGMPAPAHESGGAALDCLDGIVGASLVPAGPTLRSCSGSSISCKTSRGSSTTSNDCSSKSASLPFVAQNPSEPTSVPLAAELSSGPHSQPCESGGGPCTQKHQQHQQQQGPRQLVRRLTLSILRRHTAFRKIHTLEHTGSASSSLSKERRQHQQQQRWEDSDWDSCCLLQPADELQGAEPEGPRCRRSSSSNSSTPVAGASEKKVPRRQPSRLQRVAWSMACFSEAHQRKSVAPSRFWKRQQESFADGGTVFPRGLTNLHNTCFLNAALQALAGIPSFVSALHAGLPAEPGVGSAGLGTFQGALEHKGREDLAGSAKTPVGVSGPAAGAALAPECSADSLKREGCANDVAERLQRRRQRQRILLRLQQQRKREQPDCLAHLDESQRRHLLRELFNVLSRLTCCPIPCPLNEFSSASSEGLAAQRPRYSNCAATHKIQPQQQQQHQQQQPTNIRPERLRRALVAAFAGLLLRDCAVQQQQDCHEFLRELIDLLHEILKVSRWQVEEEAATEELLQLQADELSSEVLLSSRGSAAEGQNNQQQQQQQALAGATETSSTATTPSVDRGAHPSLLHAASGGPPNTLSRDRPGAAKGPPFEALSAATAGSEAAEVGIEEESNDEDEEEGSASAFDLAERKWRAYLTEQTSPMADFFAGQLLSEIQCSSCLRSVFVFEPAWDLSLPLPVARDKVSLSELLEAFFGAEELEFNCSSCSNSSRRSINSSQCTAYRTIRYTHPPKVLLLQIKRFSASGQKRRTKVIYPLKDLVLKTATSAASPSEERSPRAANNAPSGNPATFRLIAVIEHKGNTCHSGHYVAYVRRRRFVLPGSPRGSAAAETPKGGAAGGSHASAELRKRLGLFRSGSSPMTPLGKQLSGPAAVPELPAAANRRTTRAEEGGGGPAEAKTELFWEDGTEWFHFDDGIVRLASEVEVLSAEAYCLFYHRTDQPERQCSEGWHGGSHLA